MNYNISDILPSLNDFIEQVNEPIFSKKEIDFQMLIAKEVGYSTWTLYLQTIYDFNSNSINKISFVKEADELFKKNKTIVGSQVLLFKKHINKAMVGGLESVFRKVEVLPKQTQKRIFNFEEKLKHLFLTLLLEKNMDEDHLITMFHSYFTDLIKQNSIISPRLAKQNEKALSIIESFSMPVFNYEIRKAISPNFYFPKSLLS